MRRSRRSTRALPPRNAPSRPASSSSTSAAREFGPANITAYPVVHSPATAPHALRVEYAGTTIAYSGDTEWTDALIEASADADVFICECNFFDTKAPGHLDYETLMHNRDRLRT